MLNGFIKYIKYLLHTTQEKLKEEKEILTLQGLKAW